eukprot:6500315-Prymnesium_polylepis.1
MCRSTEVRSACASASGIYPIIASIKAKTSIGTYLRTGLGGILDANATSRTSISGESCDRL